MAGRYVERRLRAEGAHAREGGGPLTADRGRWGEAAALVGGGAGGCARRGAGGPEPGDARAGALRARLCRGRRLRVAAATTARATRQAGDTFARRSADAGALDGGRAAARFGDDGPGGQQRAAGLARIHGGATGGDSDGLAGRSARAAAGTDGAGRGARHRSRLVADTVVRGRGGGLGRAAVALPRAAAVALRPAPAGSARGPAA